MSLEGKVALVTGGSRGIGKACCVKLAKEGADVIVNYYNSPKKAGEVVERIKTFGRKAISIKADMGNVKEVLTMFDKSLEEFKRIDILVNNAAVCKFSKLFDITEKLWDKTQNTNIKGHFFLSQTVAKQMIDKKIKGRIITISSISAWVGELEQAHYCTTKAAGSNLMKSLAVILGPYGITCNAVLPGIIETDMTRKELSDPEYHKMIVGQIPAGEVGQPEDVAAAVAFFATDEAKYINGADLLVDGGTFVTPL